MASAMSAGKTMTGTEPAAGTTHTTTGTEPAAGTKATGVQTAVIEPSGMSAE